MKKLQILFGTPEFVAPEVVNFEPIGMLKGLRIAKMKIYIS